MKSPMDHMWAWKLPEDPVFPLIGSRVIKSKYQETYFYLQWIHHILPKHQIYFDQLLFRLWTPMWAWKLPEDQVLTFV
jgi:hypothetical protein